VSGPDARKGLLVSMIASQYSSFLFIVLIFESTLGDIKLYMQQSLNLIFVRVAKRHLAA